MELPSLMPLEDPGALEKEIKKGPKIKMEVSVHVQTPPSLYYKTNYHTRHLRHFLEQSRQKLNTDLFELVKEKTGTENSCVGHRNSYNYQKFCHTLQQISPAAYKLMEKHLDIKLCDEASLKRFHQELDKNAHLEMKNKRRKSINFDNQKMEDTTKLHKNELSGFQKKFESWQTDYAIRTTNIEVSQLTHNPQGNLKTKKCFVRFCNNYRKKPGKQFFVFPDTLIMCKLWLKMMKHEDLSTKLTQEIAINNFNESLPFLRKQSVCEIHFNDMCFDSTASGDNRSKKLLEGAYPTLNIVEKVTRSNQAGDGMYKRDSYSVFLEQSWENLDKHLFDLVKEQISGSDKFNYSMGFKKFCLNLYKISPAAYALLDKRFELKLPETETIQIFEKDINSQHHSYCNDTRQLKFVKILPMSSSSLLLPAPMKNQTETSSNLLNQQSDKITVSKHPPSFEISGEKHIGEIGATSTKTPGHSLVIPPQGKFSAESLPTNERKNDIANLNKLKLVKFKPNILKASGTKSPNPIRCINILRKPSKTSKQDTVNLPVPTTQDGESNNTCTK